MMHIQGPIVSLFFIFIMQLCLKEGFQEAYLDVVLFAATISVLLMLFEFQY